MTVVDPDHGLPVYQPNNLTAKAGTVVFYLENVPAVFAAPDHNMQIGGSVGDTLAGSTDVKHGDKVIFTVKDLTAGTYIFWCSIIGPDGSTHANRGMVGTLTITP
jgi:plastocyanin